MVLAHLGFEADGLAAERARFVAQRLELAQLAGGHAGAVLLLAAALGTNLRFETLTEPGGRHRPGGHGGVEAGEGLAPTVLGAVHLREEQVRIAIVGVEAQEHLQPRLGLAEVAIAGERQRFVEQRAGHLDAGFTEHAAEARGGVAVGVRAGARGVVEGGQISGEGFGHRVHLTGSGGERRAAWESQAGSRMLPQPS